MTDFTLNFGEDNLQAKLAKLDLERQEAVALQVKLSQDMNEIRSAIRTEEAEKKRLHDEKLKQEALDKAAATEAEKTKAIKDIIDQIVALNIKAWGKSRDYQKEDVVSIYNAFEKGEPGFFNANDMGLGKTIETIVVLSIIFKLNPKFKCLWLTKSSILNTGGTKREFTNWAPDLKVIEISGATIAKEREFMMDLVSDMEGVILITNYESIRTTKALKESSFDILVMDEVHKLKGGANPSGPVQLWKDVKDYIWTEDLKPKVKFVMMLSGTPMVNRVAELWAYLHIFDPEKFHSMREFERAMGIYQEYGGHINVDKILDLCLRDRMVRRTRTEVGIQLPSINSEEDQYRLIEYTPNQQRVYNEMRDQFYIWLDEQRESVLTATAIITQLIRLRQISVWPVFTQVITDDFGNDSKVEIKIEESGKVDEAMEIIEDANDQVVVFCNFNSVFEEITKRCNKLGLTCRTINGSTGKNMGEYEIGFQNGEIDVLCINSSMGEGLNLQKNPSRWKGGASVGILLDAWWNPARDDQCIARIYRQGSDVPVFIYRIHAPSSVDDYVKSISDEKGRQFGEVMNSSKLRPAAEWAAELRSIL
jgi:SNF2 family DNA or RNA helicase